MPRLPTDPTPPHRAKKLCPKIKIGTGPVAIPLAGRPSAPFIAVQPQLAFWSSALGIINPVAARSDTTNGDEDGILGFAARKGSGPSIASSNIHTSRYTANRHVTVEYTHTRGMVGYHRI